MTQSQVADQEGTPELPELRELRKTREAVEALSKEIHLLNLRTNFNRLIIGIVGALVLVVAVVAGYGYWYIQNTADKEQDQLLAEKAIIENTFRTGCENAVDSREDSRDELLEFGRYLGTRNGLPEEEINIALEELRVTFESRNPLRNCEAEAAEREAQRNS